MTGLHGVADHLSNRAKALLAASAESEADAYARSAFNRYYYATFLTVRELLAIMNSKWEETPHANIPDVLEHGVLKLIKTTAIKQELDHMLSSSRRQSIVKQSIVSTNEISSILKAANHVRKAADYEPNQRIVFGPAGFELVTYTVGEAGNWKSRADREKGILISIAKDLGLVS